MSVMSSVKKKLAPVAASNDQPVPVSKEDAQALTVMAQQAERLRYHAEQLAQIAEKARQDWLTAQQGFERAMYKSKCDLGVKSDWALIRLEDGSLAFGPQPPQNEMKK